MMMMMRAVCVVRCARMAGVIVPVFNMSFHLSTMMSSSVDWIYATVYISNSIMFIDRWVVISSSTMLGLGGRTRWETHIPTYGGDDG